MQSVNEQKEQYWALIRSQSQSCFPKTIKEVIWWQEYWSALTAPAVTFTSPSYLSTYNPQTREGVEL